MMTGHPKTLALSLTVAGLLSGCAQPSPFLSKGAGVGTLKTSLSHLEYENAQLKRELAKVQTENREFEDRLVQEEQNNDDLKSRLDDARNLLSQRGYDPGGASGPGGSPAPARPAGQPGGRRRKPPVAQIPGRIDADPPPSSKKEKDDDLFNDSTIPRGDPFGSQGRNEDLERWLPVAQGVGEAVPKKVR